MKSKLNKKILISAFAGVLAGAAIVVPNLNLNNNVKQNNGIVSSTTKNAATSTDTCLAPSANDLYNDYSYNQGFVVISNNSVINFYDWLGLRTWTFDVSANSLYLFGFDATTQTVKVKSSADGTQMYVYGTLTSNKSYIFKLDVATGSIIEFGNGKVGLVSDGTSDGMIVGANLLTFTDGYMILTPKTPDLEDGNVYVTFSEIDMATNTITNRTFNIAPAVAGQSIYAWGEIESVQKIGSYYSFAVKYDLYKFDDMSYHRPALLVTVLNAELGSDYAGYFISSDTFSFTNWQKNAIDLDKVIFNFEKIADTPNTQEIIFSMKYSTASSVAYQPDIGTSIFGICGFDSSGNVVVNAFDTSLTPNSNAGVTNNDQNNTSTSVNGLGVADNVAGILGYYRDSTTGTLYAILANANITKIGFLAITNNILYGTPTASDTPWWVDISSYASASNQSVDIGFIPGNSGAGNTDYGFISVNQQNSNGTITSKKSIFTINTVQHTFTAQNMNFNFLYSDDQINLKYNNSNYAPTLDTRDAILADVTGILLNGKQYNGVSVVSDYLLVNPSKFTVKGSVIFAVKNFWNNGQSQITRYVNIQLNPNQKTTTTTTVATPTTTNGNTNTNDSSNSVSLTNSTKSSSSSASNVVIYSVIIVAALVGIAVALIVTKILKNKRK